MLFEDFGNNYDYDFAIFDIPGSNFEDEKRKMMQMQNKNANIKYVSAKEGFERGNMIADEYIPYRNYTYRKLTPNNDREKKLNAVQELDFALTDLHFILDLHPEDMATYELFKQYAASYKNAKEEYERTYGPLTFTHTNYNNYEWSKNPWPWDNMGGSKYV